MKHAGFQKGQLALSDTQFLAAAHGLKVPFARIMQGKILGSHLGTIQRLIFADPVHYPGESAGMIRLGMIADDVVDGFRVYNAGYVCKKLIDKFLFDRVDQRNFFIQDEIGIVAGPLIR